MPLPRHIVEQIKLLIPPLNGKLHKGQSGRVGVLGGAQDYTGAPFFAAISAQRIGADLSHVICSPTAAGAIKSYSPDLIVHPILREDTTSEALKPELESLLKRLHVLIVGPGLGREAHMQRFARLAILLAKQEQMYLVLDADALLLAGQDTSLVKGYARAVLTPNIVEFKRLSEAVNIDPSTPADERASLVSKALGGVTVLQKGPTDVIATNTIENPSIVPSPNASLPLTHTNETLHVDTPGGLKRCGGQGDVLSGAVGTFLAWGKCYEDGAFGGGKLNSTRIPILAAAAGSTLTRTISRRTFAAKGRSMVTQDMLTEIGAGFIDCFGEDAQGAEGNVKL